MIEETDQAKRENVLARTYSIVNIGSIQSYIGIPYRAPCNINYKLYFKLSVRKNLNMKN